MTDRIQAGGLQVATSLYRFIAEEALPAAGIDPAGFWEGVTEIVADLTPVNRALLRRREWELADFFESNPSLLAKAELPFTTNATPATCPGFPNPPFTCAPASTQ